MGLILVGGSYCVINLIKSFAHNCSLILLYYSIIMWSLNYVWKESLSTRAPQLPAEFRFYNKLGKAGRFLLLHLYFQSNLKLWLWCLSYHSLMQLVYILLDSLMCMILGLSYMITVLDVHINTVYSMKCSYKHYIYKCSDVCTLVWSQNTKVSESFPPTFHCVIVAI